MFHKTTSTRHRRVIHQDGSPAADTGTFPRLRFAFLGAPAADVETTLPLPAVGPSRALPVRGHGTIAMRVPSGPKPGRPRLPRNLFETPEIQRIGRAAGAADDAWMGARRAEDARWSGIFLRLDQAAERVRSWTLAGVDADLAAAYAEGGTEKLLALTPDVLARLDAQQAAMAGTQVAA